MKTAISISILLLLFTVAYGQEQGKKDALHPDIQKVTIIELIQTTSYTYLFVQRQADTLWMAVPKMKARVGETYYSHGGMEMRDFKSKELNRTFESILFLNGLVDPEIVEGEKSAEQSKVQPKKKIEEAEIINIPPPDGGISISELFENKDKYKGKVVKIKGRVVKYNSGIMKMNWIHLYDGSHEMGKFDFTATTTDEAANGEIITIEGSITLNKDFGAGYFYSLIMEDGKIIR